MEIKTVDIGKLSPFEGNPKRHPKEQIDKIVRSFSEFGWTNPLLVTKDNMIVAGHARVEAARKAGIKKVPVIYLPFDGKKALAYAVADNKLAELAEWDFTKMADLMTELDDGEFDLELTGFDMSEIEEIMNWTPEEEEPFDAAAEADKIKKPKSKQGEVYRLGRHRLMCGDAMSREDVEMLMNGEKADMVFTDPPYGINMAPVSIARKLPKLKGDELKDNDFYEFLVCCFTNQKLVCSGEMFICCDWRKYHLFKKAIEETGDKVTNLIVWNKQKRAQNLNKIAFVHEFIVYTGFMGKPTFDVNVWDFGREYSEEHLTPKPIELVSRAIKLSSKYGNIILDLFGGSGSTLIACEQLNRQCRMMEIDPVYCDIIINRWEKYTGEEAKLIKNG